MERKIWHLNRTIFTLVEWWSRELHKVQTNLSMLIHIISVHMFVVHAWSFWTYKIQAWPSTLLWAQSPASLNIPLCNLFVLSIQLKFHHWVHTPLIAIAFLIGYIIVAGWSSDCDDILKVISELRLSKLLLRLSWIENTVLFREWRPQRILRNRYSRGKYIRWCRKLFNFSHHVIIDFLKFLASFSVGMPSWKS